MKHQNRRRKQSAFENPDFAGALYGTSSDRLSSGRQGERKARQFCRQVQRALNLALADRNADDGMNDLFVEGEFRRQMQSVWHDYRLSGKLRDEAPAAYKIKVVLRAQRDLVKVTRVLRPVLNYKGT